MRGLANQLQKLALALGGYQDIKCHVCMDETSVRVVFGSLRQLLRETYSYDFEEPSAIPPEAQGEPAQGDR